MPEKVLRVQRPEQDLEPPRAARHERGETRHRAGLKRRVPAEISVEAEPQLRAPRILEAAAPALYPGGDLLAIAGTDDFGYIEQGLVGRYQDG